MQASSAHTVLFQLTKLRKGFIYYLPTIAYDTWKRACPLGFWKEGMDCILHTPFYRGHGTALGYTIIGAACLFQLLLVVHSATQYMGLCVCVCVCVCLWMCLSVCHTVSDQQFHLAFFTFPMMSFYKLPWVQWIITKIVKSKLSTNYAQRSANDWFFLTCFYNDKDTKIH